MGEEEGENKQVTESRLEEALRSRLPYFGEHADSLNMLSVRRMLEEDLGVEKFTLDVHKRFIKQFVEKNLVENYGKNSDSTAEVKEATKDCAKDEQLKVPSKADTGGREDSRIETKANAVNVQDTDISESSIKKAILERADHFRTNSKTLQLVSARKLLEEDLGLQRNALDPFKKFIRKEMEEVLATAVASESSKDISGESQDSVPDKIGSKEISESRGSGENSKGPSIKDEGQVEEDSPIMGLLTRKGDPVNAQGIETSETTIKQAIRDQAHHFRSNAETLTLAAARRFLEEKLGLSKNALDPFKKFIKKQIEEVLDSPDPEIKKATQSTEAKKSKQSKRPRSPESETKSSKKSKKDTSKKSTKKVDSDEDKESSDDGGSHTSVGKAEKKNVAATPAHSKQVEHLKSIIKACGMSVPPSIYKKAKQVSEGQRETFLKKELEDILSKEGLSKNPTEKEIKEVKRVKERNKELEGIDLGNIVTSGRRRSVTSFAAPSYMRKDDKVDDKSKVSVKKKITKDPKVEKASGDEDTDGDDVKQENDEAVEKGGAVEEEEVVEEEEEEDDDEEEDDEEESNESEGFNEDDSEDSD